MLAENLYLLIPFLIAIYFSVYVVIINGIYIAIYRVGAMKKIANKYNLHYIYKEKITKKRFPNKRNIIRGEINQQKIEIFDYYEIGYAIIIRSYEKKSTVFIINNDVANQKLLRNFFCGGTWPVKKIDKILSDLKNQ
jgi:hypothetical protein